MLYSRIKIYLLPKKRIFNQKVNLHHKKSKINYYQKFQYLLKKQNTTSKKKKEFYLYSMSDCHSNNITSTEHKLSSSQISKNYFLNE